MKKYNKGDIIISVLVFAAVAITIIIGLVNWGAVMLKGIKTVASREQVFQIAEAGADYYQWHLAQAPSDYKDGTNSSGPYVHNFYDKDGNLLGKYSLTITPPMAGSTIVKIVSVGTLATSTTASTTISRTVQKTLAIPSLAKYAVVSNDNLRFGEGTEVFGPIQSNGGIRFDGVAHNLISSAKATYFDNDSDVNSTQFGVYTQSGQNDPQPPGAVPSRPDVFMAGRQFPVPASDFAGLVIGLTQLHNLAQPAAGGKTWSDSNAQGYHMVFKVTNGVTSYDMYKVNAQITNPNNCTNSSSQTQWGTWSIKTPISSNQTLVGNYSIPSNGIIFVEDDVWVDGIVNNTRVTIVAGIIGNTDPAKNSNITVNSNLLYSNYDGRDSIGLIAQGNVNAGMMSADDLRIDGALVAENGRVGRFYYNDHCTVSGTDYSHRNSITLYGMIATYIRYGFAYTDNTGYDIRDIYYDANLLYGPPPSFPQATNQYQVISWQEL